MKKYINIIYIAIFLIICCLPAALLPFFRSENPVGKEPAAEMPSIVNENGLNGNFSDECNLWFTQMMPFRADIITLKNKTDSGILGKRSNSVIVGKDGWLFTEEEIGDFIGETLSDRQIHNIAETLLILQRCAEKNGADFIFTAAPNKSTIYPEYMPAGFIQGSTSNLLLLEKELERIGVNYADLRSMLMKHKSDGEELYLKYDTHWNGIGALYGYDLLLSTLQKEHKSYSGTNYEVRRDFKGDLGKMLYPADPPLCDQYYFDMSFDSYRFIKPRKSLTNDEIMQNLMGDSESMDTQIQTVNNSAQDCVYVSRDSFFRALLPYFVDNYKKTEITRFRSLDIDKEGYDDIIYEIVERKLSDVVSVRPDISAPEVTSVSGTRVNNDGSSIIRTERSGNDLLVYGILDENIVSTNSSIYITVKDEISERSFQAFPITEKGKPGINEKSEYGFSAKISGVSSDDPDIAVIVS